jgi:hypothetical protein
MGLDVYVGPLTRYYDGDWENAGERAARERALGAATVRRPVPTKPPGNDKGRDKIRETERIRQAVLMWREVLGNSLGTNVEGPLEWNEVEDAPYFTGGPGWDGFGSLVLWAAYAEHPLLRVPAALPEEWDNDPALVRCNAEGFRSRYSHLVRNVELWLPVDFAFTFEGEDVDRRRVVFGSATTLARQLAELNAATWKVRTAEAAAWAQRRPDDAASLELKARYAFAVMTDLATRAVDHRLPMKLDF